MVDVSTSKTLTVWFLEDKPLGKHECVMGPMREAIAGVRLLADEFDLIAEQAEDSDAKLFLHFKSRLYDLADALKAECDRRGIETVHMVEVEVEL